MGRSLIQIYALCVCFATMMCLIVALGVGLYDLVQVAAPEFTMQSLPYYHSNEQFLQYFPDKKDLPPGEVERARREMYRDAIVQERRGAMQSGVFAAIILVIDIVVFAVHWGIARKAERLRVVPPQAREAA
jgi:hypothetical protein